MTYQVYKDPTSKSTRTVCLNYSSVFPEEEVWASAAKAMASHSGVVEDSLNIGRVESDSGSDDAFIEQMHDELFYPVLEDKDWLMKMTTESEEPRPSRKRSIPPASSAPQTKRTSLRLYDKEKEEKERTTQEQVQLEDDSTADAAMDCDPTSSSTEEEGSTEEEHSPTPKASTSKSSKKSSETPKQRFKGKVFQVTYKCLFDTTVASSLTNVSEHPNIGSPYYFWQDNFNGLSSAYNIRNEYYCPHIFSISLCSTHAPTVANRFERGS